VRLIVLAQFFLVLFVHPHTPGEVCSLHQCSCLYFCTTISCHLDFLVWFLINFCSYKIASLCVEENVTRQRFKTHTRKSARIESTVINRLFSSSAAKGVEQLDLFRSNDTISLIYVAFFGPIMCRFVVIIIDRIW